MLSEIELNCSIAIAPGRGVPVHVRLMRKLGVHGLRELRRRAITDQRRSLQIGTPGCREGGCRLIVKSENRLYNCSAIN